MGCTIGNIYVGTLTRADDLLLLAKNEDEMQGMLTLSHEHLAQHKYSIHPMKSKVTHHQEKKGEVSTLASTTWRLGGESMAVDSHYTHLGLEWEKDK